MDIAVNFKGGGSIVKLKPVFSIGGENVFVASKNSILQYNTKTGKLVYSYKGWDTDIVGLNFGIIDNLGCIAACSKTGKVIIWTITKRVKLYEGKIPKQNIIFFQLITWDLANELNVLMGFKKKTEIRFSVRNIKQKSEEQRKIIFKIPKQKCYIDVCQDKYFSVVAKNTVYFVNLQTLKVSRHSMQENNRKFTCVSCHPKDETVLTGDDTGRIVMWQNIFSTKKTQAIYHWHTLPVKSLAFSTLGSYFYSGADESVLVKWQLDNPNRKQFLPRLPAGICQLTVSDNNAYTAVATTDNAVRIVDSRMNQISLIQHLVLGNQFESGIIYDPITRALVMNGNIGCVQFYSPNDMSLLYNVDIVNQNKITDERECKLENTDVQKIALSKSGKWLATVEERTELNVCKEIRLKFWHFNSENQSYELTTSVEFPHESSINSIAIQPSIEEDNLKCITVGNDKMFKIWQLFQVTSVHRSGPIWKCINIGKFRDLPCQGLTFSIDGSLFATAFDSILTIWATETCELKCSLIHSNFKEKIKFIQFGQGNQCHLVTTASSSQLCVWNILTLTMTWAVTLKNINLLVSDPLSSHMLVMCGTKKKKTVTHKVYVFEPVSPNVIYSSRDLIQINEKIVTATFVPSMYSNDTRLKWYERANLYFMTANSELYCISKSEEPYNYDYQNEDLSDQISVFSKMKPQVQISEVTRAIKHHLFAKDMGYRSYRKYLEAPIETLPPIRLLAVSLLKSLVLQRDNLPSIN
ncbi:unnamed protein product [Ceutorhynchus assimilis]|uniref:WD repeat-containing protein 75 second beta-propeller domain-containing protein n=1 Tax=Ceutorhynchus assimilis TaxID=467358 RepID=A0A9P0DC84_9CUCU|nr:unnamed protein product [Ceutorhynchus assimilis]